MSVIKEAMREGSHTYCELARMGAPMVLYLPHRLSTCLLSCLSLIERMHHLHFSLILQFFVLTLSVVQGYIDVGGELGLGWFHGPFKCLC